MHISENLQENRQDIFSVYFALWKVNFRWYKRQLTLQFLSASNNFLLSAVSHFNIFLYYVSLFLILFQLLFLTFLTSRHILQLSYNVNSISLSPALDCSISIQNTIQKIFTKLETTFQNHERNHEEIVIIFSRNIFYIKFLPYTSILLVGMGNQVATFTSSVL